MDSRNTEVVSPKSAIVALLLCLFFGMFGVHRFYVGKIGTGILMLLTGGGFGIWSLVDLIVIACCDFKDKEGRPLVFERGRGSPAKLVLTIVASVVGAFIVYVVVLFTFVMWATSGVTGAVQHQMDAIRAGDVEKAYTVYTAAEFKSTTTMDDFKNFVNHFPALKENKSISINEREVKDNDGYVDATLTAMDGSMLPIQYRLIKEDGVWKILGIRVPAGIDDQTKPSE